MKSQLIVQNIQNLSKMCPLEKIQLYGQELVIVVKSKLLYDILVLLKYHLSYQFILLTCITGVDYPHNKYRFKLVYELLSIRYNSRLRIKIFTYELGSVLSSTSIFAAAGWFESEIWDREYPSEEEVEMMQGNQTLISALQISIQPKQILKKLMEKKITAIAWDYIRDESGVFPVVRTLGEIAGTTSMLVAGELLSSVNGGKGIGTGFSYDGLSYNPRQIVEYLKHKLHGEEEKCP